MRKILLLVFLSCLLVTGCNNYSQKNIVKEMNNKIANGYKLTGSLSVINNDETYNYLVDVYYKRGNYYKVILKNTLNNQSQIILKNKDGVYVLTPALNKSFRFQSDWPYNNSQIYLLDMLINDVKKDKNPTIKKNKEITIETKVNYPNNTSLIKQKIILNRKLKVKEVSVYNKNKVRIMNMKFDKIIYSPKFSKDEFSIDSIASNEKKDVTTTSSLEDVIYPLFLPTGTKLTKEERVKKKNGERVIMNYDGEKSFLLVEETADVFNEFTIIPTSGEPLPLMDTLGIVTNNSLSWTSSGIDYYLVSDVMAKEEMIEIAQSITGTISVK